MSNKSLTFLVAAVDTNEPDDAFLEDIRADINNNLANTHDSVEQLVKELDDNNADEVYRVVKITVEVLTKVTRNGVEN